MVHQTDTLAQRLKIALASNSMNQVELAHQLGIKPQNLSRIKNGNRPGHVVIPKIAQILKCSEKWLRTGEGDEIQYSWLTGRPLAEVLKEKDVQIKKLTQRITELEKDKA